MFMLFLLIALSAKEAKPHNDDDNYEEEEEEGNDDDDGLSLTDNFVHALSCNGS